MVTDRQRTIRQPDIHQSCCVKERSHVFADLRRMRSPCAVLSQRKGARSAGKVTTIPGVLLQAMDQENADMDWLNLALQLAGTWRIYATHLSRAGFIASTVVGNNTRR